MKKLTLSMLMVAMLAVPCMAEVEPAGLFSIDKTQWVANCSLGSSTLGFYGGRLYELNYADIDSGVSCEMLEFIFVSFFYAIGRNGEIYSGYVSPLFGVGIARFSFLGMDFDCSMTKTSDNWTPSSE